MGRLGTVGDRSDRGHGIREEEIGGSITYCMEGEMKLWRGEEMVSPRGQDGMEMQDTARCIVLYCCMA